ncbi:hypothetical protein V865_000551 [Kwoniella europaea PYCC6329]|uniref:Uncharacterized protein n=1 Tax=Kwoniella europaea PYCC6329 TaxID=1423913 RepID=A0AAX4K7P8_9TREE
MSSKTTILPNESSSGASFSRATRQGIDRFFSIERLLEEHDRGSNPAQALVPYTDTTRTGDQAIYQSLIEDAPPTSLTNIRAVTNIVCPETTLISEDNLKLTVHRYLSQFTSDDPLTLSIGQSPNGVSEDERIIDNNELKHVRSVVQEIMGEASMSSNTSEIRRWVRSGYRSIIEDLAGKYGLDIRRGISDSLRMEYIVKSPQDGNQTLVRDEIEKNYISSFDPEIFKKRFESTVTEVYKSGSRIIEETGGKGKAKEGTTIGSWDEETIKDQVEKDWNAVITKWKKACKTHTEESIRERIESKPYEFPLITAIKSSTRFSIQDKMERSCSHLVKSREGGDYQSTKNEHEEFMDSLRDTFQDELEKIERDSNVTGGDDGSKMTVGKRVKKIFGSKVKGNSKEVGQTR